MASIKKLPPQLVNKIAAGEVVERPASVVKELVENSLDAGATQIDIEIEEGGKKLIRITDNGRGISPEDLSLALETHATSKISEEKDLFSISSLGFRGEALASIAAISELILSSRESSASGGFQVTSDDRNPTPIAMTEGTVVEVRNLFSRTPARRKFLKRDSTEFRYILQVVNRMALSHSQIHFSLSHNGRSTFRLSAGSSLRERIGHLFNRELAEDLIPVHLEFDEYEVSGLVAPPSHSRRDRKWQYTFLNSRYIEDKTLMGAIKNALQDVIMKGRHPVLFLFLKVPAHLVDVNTHPRKLEVRFVEQKKVYKMVYSALREKLDVPDIVPSLSPTSTSGPSGQPPSNSQQNSKRDFKLSSPSSQKPLPLWSSNSSTPSTYSSPDSSSQSPSVREREGGEKKGMAPSRQKSQRRPQDEMLAQASRFFQIHNSYIIAEVPDGLRIIDQHALHEKILYVELNGAFKKRIVEVQSLLIPDLVELSREEEAEFEEHEEFFRDMGFDFELKGEGKVEVLGYPPIFEKDSWSDFFKDILSDLGQRKGTKEIASEELIATMACKGAIKFGQSLSQEEIHHLVRRALPLPHTYTCAHGRPTYLSLTMTELENMFKRKD